MVQFQDSILECLQHHTFSSMFSNKISKTHCAQILSCFGLRVGAWFTVQLVSPTFWLSSPFFFTTLHMRLGLPHPSIGSISQCVCTHPIDSMGIHFLHCAHGNKRIGTHDAIRDTFATINQRCWVPRGIRTITCTSFNHIQFLSLISRHCVYQKWHSHPSQCFHCWPNSYATQRFITFKTTQTKGRSYHNRHPIDQFVPLAIEVFGCLHKHAYVFLHNYANAIWSLKRQEGLHLSTLVTFLYQKVSITLQRTQLSSILNRTINVGLIIS